MKRMVFILLVALATTAISGGFTHKFYLSLAQAEHNPSAQSIEISLKLFTDDLERCLGNRFRENFRLGEKDEHPKTDEMLQNYLREKLKFSTSNAELKMTLLGKEVSVEETWCYLEVTEVTSEMEAVKFENRIFTEVFANQINMLKFKSPVAASQDFSLTKTDYTATILLK